MRISISKHIYKTLTENADVLKAVGRKIYPIATKSEVKFPFIVYERENITSQYNKNAGVSAFVDVSVYVLAETYGESEDIAEMVIKALDRKGGDYDGFEVVTATLTNVPESYIGNTYVQQVQFRFIIKEK